MGASKPRHLLAALQKLSGAPRTVLQPSALSRAEGEAVIAAYKRGAPMEALVAVTRSHNKAHLKGRLGTWALRYAETGIAAKAAAAQTPKAA